VRFLLLALVLQADADGVYVLTRPERKPEDVEKTYAGMAPVRYDPPADRWDRLPRSAELLRKEGAEFRVVMLGDSIVNDTSRSGWDQVLQKAVPKVRVTKVTIVRGSTGCWWYREAGRVRKYVLDQKPDLLVVGGISQRDDVESVREVLRQVREGSACDVLLMTGAFGRVDPRDDAQWSFAIPEGGYRAKLRALAEESRAGFLDLTAHWGRYVRESGKELAAFKRDEIHANAEGEQILGRILARHLAPD
jgi:lysophospholipase L1-like esterase